MNMLPPFSRKPESQGNASFRYFDQPDVTGGVFPEPLEVQITHRAYQKSQLEAGRPSLSLAKWLEAAREILSEDSRGQH